MLGPDRGFALPLPQLSGAAKLTSMLRAGYPRKWRQVPVNSKLGKVVRIDQSWSPVLRHYRITMKSPLTLEQVLVVRCPACGAEQGKMCELTTGQPRIEPHRDRQDIAKDSY
jgi:hypothetical protein